MEHGKESTSGPKKAVSGASRSLFFAVHWIDGTFVFLVPYSSGVSPSASPFGGVEKASTNINNRCGVNTLCPTADAINR